MKHTEKKRQKEQRIVQEMIYLYCRKNHEGYDRKHKKLCRQCLELASYAEQKTGRCPFMGQKTFCSNCKVHCYSPAMRNRIREVMRFSGPRMLLHHPLLAIWHGVSGLLERQEDRK